MDYCRAFILESALADILKEANRFLSKETGGPLCGYVSEDNAIVITHAAGPGKKAIRKMFSVTICGESAQKFCDEIFRRSSGFFDYVGDWHSHIGCSVRYSPPDVDAMVMMASFIHSPTKNPISLIYSRITGKFALYALNGSGHLEFLSCHIIKSIPEGTASTTGTNPKSWTV